VIDTGFGLYRSHESYIVEGGKVGGKQTTTYWPLVSLLRAVGTLTAEEIAWRHANVAAVRKLICEATTR
jgi:hypothetical protein